MTVEELKEKLKDLDDELTIVVDDGARWMGIDGVDTEEHWDEWTKSYKVRVVLS